MKYFFFLFSILVLASCNKGDQCDPSLYCNTTRMDSAFVNVTVSYSTNNNTPVPIAVYYEDIEDNLLVLRDTLYQDRVSYYLKADERYSVKAVYSIPGGTINAYDGGKLRVTSFTNCNDRCYEAPDLDLDLTLLD
jgi:hypothetical protein